MHERVTNFVFRNAMEFVKPRGSSPSRHLFVANCGPALDLDLPLIDRAFSSFGPLAHLRLADATGCRVIVSFHDIAHAQAAREALDGFSCPALNNRILHIRFSAVREPSTVREHLAVFEDASNVGIPGLHLLENFVNEDEEQGLLAAVDKQTWQALSKRRVQHYGYEFQYKVRNVDIMQNMGKLPEFTDSVVKRISALPELALANEISLPLDQLTVNEYSPGVGLSPHIDTHSAFEGAIVCLSLAGPCVMEFRKYDTDKGISELGHTGMCEDGSDPEMTPHLNVLHPPANWRYTMQCKPIFLQPRSLLVLCGEARYRWHHYIPHHKVDFVNGKEVWRNERRVSFTFRKVRIGPCCCNFKEACDSQV